ncbi:MAG TPA: hypothetical protein PKA88_01640 [Polyangiaceae bacterium]|nr:hypothetical protein [Polyangiaceae bacterium]HMR79312.1 hypothetical protein [Polyangiaceae bacterium]
MVRSERFNLRLDAEETQMLGELAQSLGITGSGVVRMLIRETHAERLGKRPKPKRKKR